MLNCSDSKDNVNGLVHKSVIGEQKDHYQKDVNMMIPSKFKCKSDWKPKQELEDNFSENSSDIDKILDRVDDYVSDDEFNSKITAHT